MNAYSVIGKEINLYDSHEIRYVVFNTSERNLVASELYGWARTHFFVKNKMVTDTDDDSSEFSDELEEPEEEEVDERDPRDIELAFDVLCERNLKQEDYFRVDNIRNILSTALNKEVRVAWTEDTKAPEFVLTDVITTCDVSVAGLFYVFPKGSRHPFVYDREALRLWCQRNGKRTNDPCTNIRYDKHWILKILDDPVTSIVRSGDLELLDLYLSRTPQLMMSYVEEHFFEYKQKQTPKPGNYYDDDYEEEEQEQEEEEEEEEDDGDDGEMDDEDSFNGDEYTLFRSTDADLSAQILATMHNNTPAGNVRIMFHTSGVRKHLYKLIPYVLLMGDNLSITVLLKHGMDLFAISSPPNASLEKGPLQGELRPVLCTDQIISPILWIIWEGKDELFDVVVEYMKNTGGLCPFIVNLFKKEPGDKYSLFELAFQNNNSSCRIRKNVLDAVIDADIFDVINLDRVDFFKKVLVHCTVDTVEKIYTLFECDNMDQAVYIEAYRLFFVSELTYWDVLPWILRNNKLDLYTDIDGTCPFYYMIETAFKVERFKAYVESTLTSGAPITNGPFYPFVYAELMNNHIVAGLFNKHVPDIASSSYLEIEKNDQDKIRMVVNVTERMGVQDDFSVRCSHPERVYPKLYKMIISIRDINVMIDGKHTLGELAIIKRNMWLMFMLMNFRCELDYSRILRAAIDPDVIIDISKEKYTYSSYKYIIETIIGICKDSDTSFAMRTSHIYNPSIKWTRKSFKFLYESGILYAPDFCTPENIFGLAKIKHVTDEMIANVISYTPSRLALANHLIAYSGDQPFFFLCAEMKRCKLITVVFNVALYSGVYSIVHDNHTLLTRIMKTLDSSHFAAMLILNVDPNVCSNMGVQGKSGTVLYHSTKNTKYNAFTSALLRCHKVDARIPGEDGMTPIMNAILVARAASITHCLIMHYIDRKYDLSEVRNKEGMTVLHALLVSKIKHDLMFVLIKQVLHNTTGLINMVDNNGKTALTYAIEKKCDILIFELLFFEGADVNFSCRGMTPIKTAIKCRNMQAVKRLNLSIPCISYDDDGLLPVHYAMREHNYEAFAFLLQTPKKKVAILDTNLGVDILSYAAECNSEHSAKLIIKEVEDAVEHSFDINDYNALHTFVKHGNVEGSVAVANGFKGKGFSIEDEYKKIMQIVMEKDNIKLFTVLYDKIFRPAKHQNERYCDLHNTWIYKAPKIRNLLKERGKLPSIRPDFAIADFGKWIELTDENRTPTFDTSPSSSLETNNDDDKEHTNKRLKLD